MICHVVLTSIVGPHEDDGDFFSVDTKGGWWQLKYVLCSPRKLGKMNPF